MFQCSRYIGLAGKRYQVALDLNVHSGTSVSLSKFTMSGWKLAAIIWGWWIVWEVFESKEGFLDGREVIFAFEETGTSIWNRPTSTAFQLALYLSGSYQQYSKIHGINELTPLHLSPVRAEKSEN